MIRYQYCITEDAETAIGLGTSRLWNLAVSIGGDCRRAIGYPYCVFIVFEEPTESAEWSTTTILASDGWSFTGSDVVDPLAPFDPGLSEEQISLYLINDGQIL